MRAGDAPFALERFSEPRHIARRIVHVRLFDGHEIGPHDRIDLDLLRFRPLAHHLPMHLAVRRNIDDKITLICAWQPSRRPSAKGPRLST